ncbi:putative DNA-binding protein Rv0500A [Sporomusaceae bacterium FL31]|nr:putative DNA-binding protein Rv0500A [Sporomusaceae bacterium FL31]GCE34826.1 putative DNA-binding protein Rv0500A [Sporomusaceae bacterium]
MMDAKQRLPDLITVKELERFLGISTPRAYELVHSKGFPTVKVGRGYRVNKDKLIEMVENGRVF